MTATATLDDVPNKKEKESPPAELVAARSWSAKLASGACR